MIIMDVLRCEVVSLSCQLISGYKLHADGLSCLDVDECITPDTETANRCDLTSTICINQIGGYSISSIIRYIF